MNSFMKKITVSFLAVALIIGSPVVSKAAVEIPEKIRIGIYFDDSKTGRFNAVDNFKVNADKGMEFGFSSDL